MHMPSIPQQAAGACTLIALAAQAQSSQAAARTAQAITVRL
ncbi:MAG: hypothetical protein ACKO25_04955 [Cyanobium sp.]